MRISDWSSDVCSSDLRTPPRSAPLRAAIGIDEAEQRIVDRHAELRIRERDIRRLALGVGHRPVAELERVVAEGQDDGTHLRGGGLDETYAQHTGVTRSEEHTSQIQAPMRT